MMTSHNASGDNSDVGKNQGKFFENFNTEKKTVDEKNPNSKRLFFSFKSFRLVDKIFDRVERICIILWGNYLNEEDAALLFRLKDPLGSGKNTIRNYALRSKKISFAKVGRFGLLFHKDDLEKLYHELKIESFRDL